MKVQGTDQRCARVYYIWGHSSTTYPSWRIHHFGIISKSSYLHRTSQSFPWATKRHPPGHALWNSFWISFGSSTITDLVHLINSGLGFALATRGDAAACAYHLINRWELTETFDVYVKVLAWYTVACSVVTISLPVPPQLPLLAMICLAQLTALLSCQ